GPETRRPRRGGVFIVTAAPGSGSGLLDRLLRHALAGDLLRDRRSGGAGGLGHGLQSRIAVAGVVALALGGLAVALAHRVAPGSIRVGGSRRAREPGILARARGGTREAGNHRLAQCECAQAASWTWPWFSRRFATWASPTRVPPKVITTACITTEWCSGGYSTASHSAPSPGSSRPSARITRWRR